MNQLDQFATALLDTISAPVEYTPLQLGYALVLIHPDGADGARIDVDTDTELTQHRAAIMTWPGRADYAAVSVRPITSLSGRTGREIERITW